MDWNGWEDSAVDARDAGGAVRTKAVWITPKLTSALVAGQTELGCNIATNTELPSVSAKNGS